MEDVSTHPIKQTANAIHPAHVEAIVKHAVRKIPGGTALANKIFSRKKTTNQRMADDRNDKGNHLKHFWN